MRVEKDVTVNAPIDKVYSMWIDFVNFPKFMSHVESVTSTGDKTYHWKAKIGPIEKEWDAEVKGMVTNRTVSWHATSGANNAGAVTLSERGHLTEMHVVIEYDATWLENIGDVLTGSFSNSVEEDVERFKRLAEGHDPNLASTDSDPSAGQHGNSTV